jgi:hypothetical protein
MPAEIRMTDGLALLVRAVIVLPSQPGDSFADLVKLASLPDSVLELVATEIIELYNHREIDWRPTCAEVSAMARAAMRARHQLMMLRGERREAAGRDRTPRLRRGPRARGNWRRAYVKARPTLPGKVWAGQAKASWLSRPVSECCSPCDGS